MKARYVVYGAGAVGGVIGGRLAQAGHEVVLIARGPHADALASDGLTLQSPDGTVQLQIPVVRGPGELAFEPGDVVVLGMKSQDTPAALAALSAAAGPDVTVVCAQNGVDNERQAARSFGHVLGLCVLLPGAHLRPGCVQVFSAPVSGAFDLGRYPRGTDDRTAAVAADLSSASFDVRVDPDVMRRKHGKLLVNLANAFEAACGPAARAGELYRRARDEAVRCFEAAGIAFSTAEEDADRYRALTLRPIGEDRYPGSSSWQSLARGAGSIEADYLNGEIVLLGRLHGVPTPANQLAQEVARSLAAAHAEPGRISEAALLARLPPA